MINRTVIVTAANALLARALAAAMSAGGVGMFESPLPSEANPMRFISSGQIDAAFGPLLPLWTIAQDGTLQPPDQATKDAAVAALTAAVGGLATAAQLRDLVDTTIVVDCDIQTAAETCARLGLLAL